MALSGPCEGGDRDSARAPAVPSVHVLLMWHALEPRVGIRTEHDAKLSLKAFQEVSTARLVRVSKILQELMKNREYHRR